MTTKQRKYWINDGLAAIAKGLSEDEYVASKPAGSQYDACRGYRQAFHARTAHLPHNQVKGKLK
jgi:hypothetical protein